MAEKILVFSGKGGAGKSSVSVLLAKALSFSGKTTLLVDADVGLRSLDLLTDTGGEVVYNWLDVISGGCSARDAVVARGANEPALLGAPENFTDEINFETLKKLFDELDADYDYILIDSPAGLNDFHKTLFALCGKALVISSPDAVSLRSAGTATQRLFEADENKEIRLIVNKFVKKDALRGRQTGLDGAVDAVGARLIGVVGQDNGIMRLPSESFISEKTREAFLRIARRLRGESIPLQI